MNKDDLIKTYESLACLAAHEPLWLQAHRNQAISAFADAGFPTLKNEDWKYLQLTDLLSTSFQREEIPNKIIVNVKDLPTNIEIMDLSEAILKSPEKIEPYFAQIASCQNPFTALNTAFSREGIFISIPEGLNLEAPIQLLLTTVNTLPCLHHPRIIIVVGEGAHLNLIEHSTGRTISSYFTNGVTEIFLKRNTALNHYKIQQEDPKAYHVSTLQVLQDEGSRFVSYSISLGALLARNDIRTSLIAENTNCELNGLYEVGGNQQVDHHTLVDHLKPRGTSNSCYKGILNGHAKGVFNGKIVVHPHAIKTDARLSNKNLLLSEHASMAPKPELQIYADDVKCSHGATVGQLDEEALFYLRSRGLDENAAKKLLIEAFANELIGRIEHSSIRQSIESIVCNRS